jgi:predicted nucleic acid-binding protein
MSGDLIFVDTSGFVALLDADDAYHQQSSSAWQKYINEDSTLCTSDYIRLESWALIQRRLGLQADAISAWSTSPAFMSCAGIRSPRL